MNGLPLILLVEDDELLSAAYASFLSELPCSVITALDGQSALQQLQDSTPDILILDLLLPDMHGHEILNWIQQQSLNIKSIVVTTEASAEVAIDAMKLGAIDYLIKPLDEGRLITTINNYLERLALEKQLQHYKSFMREDSFEGFIGMSPPMQVVFQIIENAALSDANIFITGESGTGKELCAEAIHLRSQRKDAPLVALNCAAIPRELMESEIFGHIKGAFTGASENRQGAAARAEGGSLFFDEVCELGLELQAKLLRFIQTHQYQPVGSSQLVSSDVRFICATNRDPWEEVQAGHFREDLYYRLYVVPVALPPLKQRDGDIILLAEHFLEHFSAISGKKFDGFTPEAEQRLLSYDWPGNVRELENVIHNLVVLNSGGGQVLAQMLQLIPKHKLTVDPAERSSVQPVGSQNIRPLWEQERDIIERAIRFCNGNVAEAAKKLGISDSTIYRKRQRWEVSD